MPRKTIALPGRHDLDIGPILPIVDSSLFQRLRYIKQLGTGYLVFPSAYHTRFEHALDTYALMLERTELWLKESVITEEEAAALCVLALLHDIGHGPYSHATEPLCSEDHNTHGLRLIHKLRHEIEKCGVHLQLLTELFARKHPLCVANCHRPLGTDKLAYTWLDAARTTEAASFRMGDLLNHVHYYPGSAMAVDSNFLPEVKQLQAGYVTMHSRVYFRKAATIAQYFLQQIVARATASGDVDPTRLSDMTDSELDAALMHAKDRDVRELFSQLLMRQLPKAAVVLRDEEMRTPDTDGKHVVTYRVPWQHLETFAGCHQRSTAAIHERAIAAIAHVPASTVLVTPVAAPERFVPDSVNVCNQSRIIGTLRDFYPVHYEELREELRGYAEVRVCVLEPYRRKLAQPDMAYEIFTYLQSVAVPYAA